MISLVQVPYEPLPDNQFTDPTLVHVPCKPLPGDQLTDAIPCACALHASSFLSSHTSDPLCKCLTSHSLPTKSLPTNSQIQHLCMCLVGHCLPTNSQLQSLVHMPYMPPPSSQIIDEILGMQGRMPSSTCCPGGLTGSLGMLLW